ncbi:unnamed protein product, partial [Didymodactylos carnosus]
SSNSAVGCTTASEKVERNLTDFPSLYLRIFDTAGLSESDEGAVTTKEAFIQLVKTLYAVQGGIHLLICCARNGRLSGQAFKSNYRVFVEGICESCVPCILVITHCDENDELDSFWNQNKDTILTQLKFDFKDGISVTTKKTGKNACIEDYNLSREKLITAIMDHALEKPWQMVSYLKTVAVFFKKVWNSLSRRLKFLSQVGLQSGLVEMFEVLGCSKDDAVKEANQLYKALQEPST